MAFVGSIAVGLTQYGALFRALSKYVFGHYGTLERYGHDLVKRFGDDAPVERLSGH